MSGRHVLELCDRWDRLPKGESPTTKAVREALAQAEPHEHRFVAEPSSLHCYRCGSNRPYPAGTV